MSFKMRDIFRIYLKLDGNVGFQVKLREGRDTVVEIFCDDKFIVFTRVSHGKGKLNGNVIHQIRRQFKLEEGEFRDFIRCKLDAAGYKDILKKRGIL